MDYDLGYIELEQRTLQPLDNPFAPRLSPTSPVRIGVHPQNRYLCVRSGHNFKWCRKRDSNPRPHHYEARNRGVPGVHVCPLLCAEICSRTAAGRHPGHSRLRTPLNALEQQRTTVEHGSCNRDATTISTILCAKAVRLGEREGRVLARLRGRPLSDGGRQDLRGALLRRSPANPRLSPGHLQTPVCRGTRASYGVRSAVRTCIMDSRKTR